MSNTQAIIQPLDLEKQQLVINRTYDYINQAKNLFNISSTDIEVSFNLTGKAAGMYRVKKKLFRQTREIRYNTYIFSKYYKDNFDTTIPHEVAHYISDLLYGLSNIKPHGKEWKQIMQAFNANASVTADYDLSGIPQRNKTTFTYQCGCKEHQLGAIRHNRIKQKSGSYICKYCKQTLMFKHAITNEEALI